MVMIIFLNVIVDKYFRDYNECFYSLEIKMFFLFLKYIVFLNFVDIGFLYEDENLWWLMKNVIFFIVMIINRSLIIMLVIVNIILGLFVKDDIYYIKI